MKHLGKTDSPLYTYNSRTHTYSFNTKKSRNTKRKKEAIIVLAVIIITIGLIFIINSCVQHKTRIDLSKIPAYSGVPYCEINNNVPFFTNEDINKETFEIYGDLDSLGRCTYGYANLCLDLMPIEERKSIQSVSPTGWQSTTYDFIDQGYLYNRCHLIAFMLAGENDNEKNLITGTRYMNVEGMLPFEKRVAKYIELSGDHVLYRVTPIFEGNNLVASGVEMEALSIGDDGENICFNVFIYNVQPGILIDYKTGESRLDN